MSVKMITPFHMSRPSLKSRIAILNSHARLMSNLAFDKHEPPAGKAGKPILFLHGLFGSKKNNRTMSRVLARDLGRPVFALDLRNHGESPHNATHDYLSMAGDVVEFIDKQQLQQPTIIGHSMGAKTAMTIALKSPEKISNIIAVDNAPIDAVLASGFGSYVRGMKKIENAKVTRLSEADKILQEVEESLPIRQFLLGNLHKPKGQTTQQFSIPLDILGKALDHMGDFPFKNPDEVRCNKPALFIRGTQSRYVPNEALPIIGRFFPKFRLVDVDAGHWLISEQPEEFRRAAVEFLRDRD
ncbi:hypothetical protein VHEMI10087 [[Torrubiella] hemipterigena]|uniref:AB hydrolase-1 domain-containing protein n=1 Tax=[Torrubiella] hemipterigena TaxID=1531966 RepID=A0A0A1TR84_9HYPO|nr:hypothetical protein VHEMI10087 [[Torrubiella] hemipterigena]